LIKAKKAFSPRGCAAQRSLGKAKKQYHHRGCAATEITEKTELNIKCGFRCKNYIRFLAMCLDRSDLQKLKSDFTTEAALHRDHLGKAQLNGLNCS